MKLLHWMHRKFRQNSSGDVLKDFQTGWSTCNCLSGGPSLDDHQKQLGPMSPAIVLGRPMRDRRLSVDADESSLFEGLLSIGTLGLGSAAGLIEEAVEDEEETEQAQKAELHKTAMIIAEVEEITEKEETEVATETDLMVISTELEKVLAEAAEKEGDSRLSSARPSHVCGGWEANEACPLQEYLLGSAAAALEVGKERKETKRASLGELFMIEEGGEKRSENEKKKKKKKIMGEDEKGPVSVMMKWVLMRHGPHGSSRRSDSGGHRDGGGAPPPAANAVADAKDPTKNAKFHKILQIFHRKIHPENEEDCKKPAKKSSKYCRGSNHSPGSDGDSLMMKTPWKRTCRKVNKCGLDRPSLSVDGSRSSTSTREHWIKTDAEYLVLEL